jgi:hypothetical protein
MRRNVVIIQREGLHKQKAERQPIEIEARFLSCYIPGPANESARRKVLEE